MSSPVHRHCAISRYKYYGNLKSSAVSHVCVASHWHNACDAMLDALCIILCCVMWCMHRAVVSTETYSDGDKNRIYDSKKFGYDSFLFFAEIWYEDYLSD